eukprot:1920559-Pyramimonas_sp.AAC.1
MFLECSLNVHAAQVVPVRDEHLLPRELRASVRQHFLFVHFWQAGGGGGGRRRSVVLLPSHRVDAPSPRVIGAPFSVLFSRRSCDWLARRLHFTSADVIGAPGAQS